MLLLVAVAALLGGAHGAAGQTLRGRVVEEGSSAGISRVSIVSLTPAGDSSRSVLTDGRGAFVLRLADAGRHGLRVVRAGFRGYLTEPIEVAGDEEVALELRMAPADVGGAPVLVLGRRRVEPPDDYEERIAFMRLLGMGRYLLEADIDSLRASAASEVLAAVDGVSVVPSAEGPLFSIQSDAASCTPALFVDGLSLRGVALDRIVAPALIEAVEVYAGSVEIPSEFTDARGCGVILVWTHRIDARPLPWRRAVVYVAMAVVGIVLFAR